MKHLLVVTLNMQGGGCERVIAQLVKYADNLNIKCTIMTIDNKDTFYELPNTVKIIQIGNQSKINTFDKLLKYHKVRRLTKKIKPDVVLSMPENVAIYTGISLIGLNIPIVVSERNNPWVMPIKKTTRLLRRLYYPHASGIVFQTKQAKKYFSKKVQEKGVVIPNPLDLERIPKQFKGKRRKEVVGVGRLVKQKNFSLLIKAFASFYQDHPEYTLCIYGDGDKENELRCFANKLLPKGVCTFPGKVPDLLQRINDASMFVLSSDYEGMPNVVIEAMAMGIPVISTDCPSGGPKELIDNEKNGILVPVRDAKALAKAMCNVALSKDFADRLGEKAINVKGKLNINIIGKRWMVYLNEIYSRK